MLMLTMTKLLVKSFNNNNNYFFLKKKCLIFIFSKKISPFFPIVLTEHSDWFCCSRSHIYVSPCCAYPPLHSHALYLTFPPTAQTKRPQSASSVKRSSSSGPTINAAGLSGDEIRMVRRIKEEFQRRSGWIRIFPSPDSWELYRWDRAEFGKMYRWVWQDQMY